MTKTNGWFSIGGNGTGIYNLSAGNLSATGDFNIGDGGNGKGTLNVSGTGTATSTGAILIGKGANNIGLLNVSGGGMVNANLFSIGGPDNSTNVGRGFATISSGQVNATGELWVGEGGASNGLMDLNGGVVATNSWFAVGRQAGSYGVLNVSGTGTARITAGNSRFFIIGSLGGTGTLNMTGGTVEAPNGGDLRLSEGGGSATANLSGGILKVDRIVDNGATSYLHLNGTTMQAISAQTTYLQGIDNAVVGVGGAIFDTNGNNITVNQTLAAPTGSGLSSIGLTNGGAGYPAQPIVKIIGGGGIGASAIANVTGGVITGFTITNPGIGYTSTPTVTLVDGGPTTAATLGAIGTGLNSTSGGLTKLGNGTLILGSGSSSYGGPTIITGGTLGITSTGNGGAPSTLGASSPAAANLIFNGGALQYLGASSSTDRNFTINAGKTAIIDVPAAATTFTLAGNSAATNGNLTKIGDGTLSLTGAGYAHTGTTTVNAGVLAASGSYLAGFAVGGTGHLTALNLSVGTLSVPTLALGASGFVDFEFGTGNDVITIANPGGLTLGTTGLNFYQEFGTTPFTANGTYTLFDYSGTFTGLLPGAFTIANSQVGKNYVISNNLTATTIELTINDAIVTEWTNGTSNSLWNATDNGNWTTGIPNGNGAVATFGLLATPGSVAVTGGKTAGSIVFNNAASYTLTGSTITLNNGLGVPSITILSGSHAISAPVQLSQSANLVLASGSTLTLSGAIGGAGTGLTIAGADATSTVVLSSPNGYTGPTTINAGTLEIAGGASIGGSSGLVEKNGAIFRINAGGATTVTTPVTLDLAGGTATAVSGAANGTGNFALELSPGTSATLSGLLSNAGGSLVIRGGGALTLTNPGANVLSNAAGLSTVLQAGSLTLNGGALATYAVTGGELTIGDNTPNQVSLTLASGTLNVGTYTSIGRGNGTTGLASSLNLTGGTLVTLNLFTGYDNGVGGYNAAPAINVSGAGKINATTTRLGESPGSKATLSLSNTAMVTNTGDFQIGFGGNAVVTVADSAILTLPQLSLGTGNNGGGNIGAGVIRQTGGQVVQAGGFGNDWRIGGYNGANDALAYGAYEISAGTLTTNRNFQIGSFGRGVMDISGTGSVTTTGGFPIVGRFVGGVGLLNISGGGSFNNTVAGNFFIIGEEGTGVVNMSGGELNIASGPGGAGSGGGTGGIRLGHTATGIGLLNLKGGIVTASGIAKSNLAGLGAVYFNGGTLKASASNTTFLQGLDAAVIGPGGAFFNTNGNNITVSQDLTKPSDSGVKTIPVLNGGSGYLSQPIVQITGGGGFGATAIANVTGGVVTSITITNPGLGYSSAPTVTLLGNGTAVLATLDTATLDVADVSGGVTKNGAGTLTLNGNQNYAFLTTNAGRTNLDATLANASINNVGGILNVGANAVNSNVTVSGTTVFLVDQTLASLSILGGGTVTLGGPAASPAPAGEDFGDLAAPLAGGAQAVPEPGTAALLLAGLAGLLGRRRRA